MEESGGLWQGCANFRLGGNRAESGARQWCRKELIQCSGFVSWQRRLQESRDRSERPGGVDCTVSKVYRRVFRVVGIGAQDEQ
jgi:hypothetical protein